MSLSNRKIKSKNQFESLNLWNNFIFEDYLISLIVQHISIANVNFVRLYIPHLNYSASLVDYFTIIIDESLAKESWLEHPGKTSPHQRLFAYS